jgi:hypothetical protein
VHEIKIPPGWTAFNGFSFGYMRMEKVQNIKKPLRLHRHWGLVFSQRIVG